SATMWIAFGAAGVVITDHVWYFAGHLGGDRLLRLYCRLTFSSPDCVGRTTDWFKRYGALTIVVGRFVAAVRVLAWPLARGHGVGYPVFLALDVTAALVWTSTWVGLGWVFRARWVPHSGHAPRGGRVLRRPVVPGFRRGSLGGPRARSRRDACLHRLSGLAPPSSAFRRV